MKFLAAMIAVMMVSMPAASMACSPAPWAGEEPPTAEQAVAAKLDSRNYHFVGKVLVESLSKTDGDSTSYGLTVLKQYAGEPQNTLTAVSNETDSCAFYGKEGDVMIVALNRNQDALFTISDLSGYFYGQPMADVESYLDSVEASGMNKPEHIETESTTQ